MRKLLITGLLPLLACSVEDFERIQSQTPPITELSHTVTPRMHRGAVVLTVNRQLRNDSAGYQELTHTVMVPDAAVVTSLRADGEGVLLASDEATTRWSELLSPGDAEPTTSVMLEWTYVNRLQLRIFGFAPGATVSIEYDLQLPPSAQDGRWVFDYPTDSDEEGVVLAVPTFDLSRTPGATEDDEKVTFPRAPIDRTEAKWALFQLGSDRTMWRFELDAAEVLEAAPQRPNVVFVVDASHSQNPKGIAAQLELLAPYLANVPDAQVEVVLYRRFAERLFGRFVPVSDVPRLLASTPADRLAPGNGSNLELGARLAAEALTQVGSIGRIVLFTDEQLREGFSNEQTIAELAKAPRDTVVHVVAREESSDNALEESWEESHALAPIAAAHGGVFFRLTGRPGEPPDAAATMLGLVRPIRIDNFEIEAKGLDGDRLDAPSTLAEGDTLRFTALAPNPPREVTVTGKIWAREYRKVVPIDSDLTQWMPGLAIGLQEIEMQLTDDEVRVAALQARAVSRVTSYLSTRPTAGASTIGTLRGGSGGYGYGSIGCGMKGTHSTGCAGYGVATIKPDHNAVLRELLAPGLAACAREQVTGTITLEATGDEIVAVDAASSCVTEVVWAVRLTGIFSTHRSYTLEL